MSEPVMKCKSGAIAYECEFTINPSVSVLGSGTRLIPCPFCGGAAKFEEHKKYGSFRVYCDNYDCRIMPRTLWYCGADDAASAWNKRAERTCQRVDENGYSFRFKCSACGYASLVHNCETRLDELPRYCPNCGAKVVGE